MGNDPANDDGDAKAPRDAVEVAPPREAVTVPSPRDAGQVMPPRQVAAVAPPRRRVLGVLVGAGSAAYAGALAWPATRFLTPAEAPRAEAAFVRVVRLDALEEAVPVRVRVRGDRRDAFTVTRELTLGSVWLRRTGNDVTALSAECPHLGCAVAVTEDRKAFGCPCHTSRFSLAGAAESGPSPRAMDPLLARVVDGWVEVAFVRYRHGSQHREVRG